MHRINIALAGPPNCGKTVLFNALTGAHQKVANYPGITVEYKVGHYIHSSDNKIEIIDLPGTYSLEAHSPDEQVTLDYLSNDTNSEGYVNLILAIGDATNLKKSLGLLLDLKKTGKPIIFCLNMIDLATKRGIEIDVEKLSKELGVPIVPTTAIKEDGLQPLYKCLEEQIQLLPKTPKTYDIQKWQPLSITEVRNKFIKIDKILSSTVKNISSEDLWTVRLDSIFMNKFLGLPILFVILLLVFQAVFSWASWPMDLIEELIEQLGNMTSHIVAPGLLQDFLVDGVIAGVGAVSVFLPQILILFFFIFLLEASGYMARAAFLVDRLMALIGLQGKSFVPLLSSFACAIPGIMATRTIKNPKDRIATILVAPLMTCSARLPVYVLLIGAFIPNKNVGPLNLQGLVMFGLFLLGILSAAVVAFIMKNTILKGSYSSFLLELPTYKLPNFKHIFFNVMMRAKIFIKKAATVILSISVVLWVLSTFPKAPKNWEEPAITYSYAGRIGKTIEPLIKPLGFDWRIGTALIPGFGAREVFVGAIATVFSVESEDEDQQNKNLTEEINSTWPLATGLALLIWYVFAPQCLATFAVMRRETNGWKWPAVTFSYMLTLAYIGAYITYNLTLLLGF